MADITYPDFHERIDWTWIDDAVAVTSKALFAPLDRSRIFNVAGDKRFMREAAVHLARRFPGTRFTPQPARTPPSAWSFTNDGLEAAIGVVPTTTMETGIDLCLKE